LCIIFGVVSFWRGQLLFAEIINIMKADIEQKQKYEKGRRCILSGYCSVAIWVAILLIQAFVHSLSYLDIQSLFA
jgi:hypothetical protein